MMELSTLLRIAEILVFVDLKFPIFFNKSEDGERIIVEFISVDSVAYARDLFSSLLRSAKLQGTCMWGRTWRTTFPGASITS